MRRAQLAGGWNQNVPHRQSKLPRNQSIQSPTLSDQVQPLNCQDPPHPKPGGLTLDKIDLRIEPGQLVGVVGPVGSSKTSLLMAIMNEITPATDAGVGMAAATCGNGSGEVSRNLL